MQPSRTQSPSNTCDRRVRNALVAVLTACALVGGPSSLMLAATTPASAATSGTTVTAPAPRVPAGLPSALEDLASYVPANSCDPTAKPGTTRLGELLTATYRGTSYDISRTCGTDPLPTSEHYDGRAVDWMTSVRDPQGKADAQALIAWLFAPDTAGNKYANARRLGVMYIIWNNRIWGSYRAADGWRAYSGCATATSVADDTRCHRNHMHISLSWEGAMARTSFWTRSVAAPEYGPCRAADLNWAAPYGSRVRTTPCPSYPLVSAPAGSSALMRTLTTYSGMRLGRGSSGPVVRGVQQAVGTGVDGTFGSLTAAAVVAWQTKHALPASGVVDVATWRALLAANRPALTPTPTPLPAPTPTPTRTPAPTPTPVAAASPTPAPSTVGPLTRWISTVLRPGSRGPAVRALQKRLHVPVDGRFGPVTGRAVLRFKIRHHLPHDRVVGRRCWRALGA